MADQHETARALAKANAYDRIGHIKDRDRWLVELISEFGAGYLLSDVAIKAHMGVPLESSR